MNKIDVVAEIAVIANLLYRMGFDNVVEQQALFVSFLGELGIETPQGKPINLMNYRSIVGRLTPADKLTIYKLLDLDILYV